MALNTRTKYFELLEDRRLLSLGVGLDQMEYWEETSDLFEVIGVQRWRGVDVLLVNLKPVQYNIETGSLSYYETMDLSVHLESTSGSTTVSELIYRADDIRPLASWVDNPQQLNDYASRPSKKATGSDADTEQPGICDSKSDYQYVIITSDEVIQQRC